MDKPVTYKCLILMLFSGMFLSNSALGAYTAPISESDVVVPESLSYRDQVKYHQSVKLKIESAFEDMEKQYIRAEKEDSLKLYKEVVNEAERVDEYDKPYQVGYAQAQTLKSDGYLLSNWEGETCKNGQCEKVDPITALFLLALDAFANEMNKGEPFGENNDLIKFLARPAGGENSEFVRIRSIIVPENDNGEIARLLRDPVKRPVEVIQNLRDEIIPPDDNGEISKLARDPIKCTVGKLFGHCD